VLDDHGYYAARAAEERVIAMASRNIRVRAVHLEMALRYDALVRGASPRRTWIVGAPQKDATTGSPSTGETVEVAAITANITRMLGRRGR